MNEKNIRKTSLYSKRRFIIILMFITVFLYPFGANCHPSKTIHADEIQEAFGFMHPEVYEWLCYISSDMIDKHNPFYNQLKEKFPDFKCKHRCLFHWNFNGIPWTPGLESRVKAYARLKYGQKNYLDYYPIIKEDFLNELRKEQKRRNRYINEKTEYVFGFASGGKDGSYANFFAAMAYDLHLLGDYTSADNTDLNGLVEFNTLINGIIVSINRLDSKQGKKLTKGLRSLLNTHKDVQYQADDIMEFIQKELPLFIQNAEEGSIKRRLEKRGFKFKEISAWEKLKNFFK